MQDQVSQTSHNDSNSSESSDATDQKMAAEREAVVKDLLCALRSISRINMEPSSESFVNSPSISSSSAFPYIAIATPFNVPPMDEAIYISQRGETHFHIQTLDTSFSGSCLYVTDQFFQINKIRQVASTLIQTPQSRKGDIARKAEEYLPRKLRNVCLVLLSSFTDQHN